MWSWIDGVCFIDWNVKVVLFWFFFGFIFDLVIGRYDVDLGDELGWGFKWGVIDVI